MASERWRPIETFDRDRADVQEALIFANGQVGLGSYDADEDEWCWAGWDDPFDGALSPTHWMPLPAPPVASSEEHVEREEIEMLAGMCDEQEQLARSEVRRLGESLPKTRAYHLRRSGYWHRIATILRAAGRTT